MARVILHSFDPVKDYYNYCEFAKSPYRESSDRHSNNQQNQVIDKPVSVSNTNGVYKVIPNPNNGIFSLTCPNNSNINIKIYDSKGAKVYEQSAMPNQHVVYIDLSSSLQGIYNMAITSNNDYFNIKFAITK